MVTDFTSIKDSFISAYSYNEMLNVLTLVFSRSKTSKEYSVYSYMGVPPNIVKTSPLTNIVVIIFGHTLNLLILAEN
jgi:hypothetical protein